MSLEVSVTGCKWLLFVPQGGSLPERRPGPPPGPTATRRVAARRGDPTPGAYYTRRDPNGIGILLNKAGAYYTRRDPN